MYTFFLEFLLNGTVTIIYESCSLHNISTSDYFDDLNWSRFNTICGVDHWCVVALNSFCPLIIIQRPRTFFLLSSEVKWSKRSKLLINLGTAGPYRTGFCESLLKITLKKNKILPYIHKVKTHYYLKLFFDFRNVSNFDFWFCLYKYSHEIGGNTCLQAQIKPKREFNFYHYPNWQVTAGVTRHKTLRQLFHFMRNRETINMFGPI